MALPGRRGARAWSFGLLALGGCVLMVLPARGTDTVLIVVEGLLGVALAVAALTTRERQSRRVLAVAAGWVWSTSIGDVFWLASSGTSAIGSFPGHQEPVSAIVFYLLHYVLVAVALLLTTPRTTRPPGRWSGVEEVMGPVQVGASAAALIALATPIGLLLDDSRTYSLFLVLDLVLAAAAVGLLARGVLRVPRLPRDHQRRVTSTSVSVVLFSCADAGVELGLLRGSQLATSCGFSAGLLGVAVLVVGHRWSVGRADAIADCLPRAPGRGRRSRLVLRLGTQHVLPASIVVGTTVLFVDGDPVSERPVTLGLALVALIATSVGNVAQLLGTEREEAAAGAARRDDLTGAWTRRGLLERLQLGERATWTVVVLDLDGFKSVNDTFGHSAGDRVLRVTVERLAAAVGGRGVVARMGGDEFVVLLHEGAGASDVVDELRRAVGEPIELAHGVCSVGASVGLAQLPVMATTEVGTALELAVAEADHRMYEQKRARMTPRPRSGGVPPVAAP